MAQPFFDRCQQKDTGRRWQNEQSAQLNDRPVGTTSSQESEMTEGSVKENNIPKRSIRGPAPPVGLKDLRNNV
jgi:hypothetical protein